MVSQTKAKTDWQNIENFGGKINEQIEFNSVKETNDKPGEYGKNFIKIKFNSDDNLLLNKKLKLHSLTIIVRSVLQEDD